MPIRHSVKAILIQNEKILLNRCRRADGTRYFDLPGGGQELYESMEDALCREVWEETGYQVRLQRLAAVGEEIYENPALRAQYPDYTHRHFTIFLAALTGGTLTQPAVPDFDTEGPAWISLSELKDLPDILPTGLKPVLPRILQGETVYLGTAKMAWE